VDAQGNKAQNNADCNDHESIVQAHLFNLNEGITPTARELQGLKQSIRKRPDTRIRPDYHYDQRTDHKMSQKISLDFLMYPTTEATTRGIPIVYDKYMNESLKG